MAPITSTNHLFFRYEIYEEFEVVLYFRITSSDNMIKNLLTVGASFIRTIFSDLFVCIDYDGGPSKFRIRNLFARVF